MSRPASCIALAITDQETNAQIKNLGVGLLELRCDLFKKLDPAYIVEQIRRRRLLKIPLLVTVRNQKKEGAVRVFPDGKKLEIIKAALPLVDMVDIELSSVLLKEVMASARRSGKKVIVSSHFFDRMPSDLESIFKKSLRARADIVKIAAKASSFKDVMTMLQFTYRHRQKPLITMCLGPKGAISRLLLPAAGSLYTYSFVNKPTAPGQLDVATIKAHLKLYFS